LAFVYGILYLIFFAYPYSFQLVRGWETGTSSLPFIAVFIGIFLSSVLMAVDSKTRFQKLLVKSGGAPIPEARLPPMIIGSILLPIGLFWFAWTSNKNISWVPQVISGIFIGAGILAVFLPGLIYMVDCYLLNANSALSANTFARSLFAAAFPLFATYMYENLGVAWATSILGFVSAAMIPFPIIFYYHGKSFRAKGKYTFDLSA
jgi:DHA1 family multidrug resistance protein-like MFS transporter